MRKFEIAKGFEKAGVNLPTRGSKDSAGYDFASLEGVSLKPGERTLLHTGVKAKMNEGEVLVLAIRSSIGAKRGICLANGIGVIDADYYGNPKNDGEIMLAVVNTGTEAASIEKGERVAQGIFLNYLTTDDDETDAKRVGGYGSTGRK